MEKYNHKEIERKWQKRWEKEKRLWQADDESGKEKLYCLDMFPYPSGEGLHVGHVESYTATDIISRYFRMRGKNVMHPQGWDAFGLPAENYAIQTKIHPAIITKKAIATFKKQMKKMGFSYDWSREINSSDPEYYRWTQWFFLLLYKNGLAYRKKAKVNWCENCQTVLANEQAEGGICERCKNKVIQKDLEQWFFKITDFIEDQETPLTPLLKGGGTPLTPLLKGGGGGFIGAQKKRNRITKGLINGLNKVDWPESTKQAQRSWIGKSEGAIIKFEIRNPKSETPKQSLWDATGQANSKFNPEHSGQNSKYFLEVFTTRLDTIYGCTYCVVAPEHELITNYKLQITNWDEVKKYLIAAQNKTELERMETKDKSGVELKGIKVINPFTKEEVPIFVADYVLGHYGTGAVMAVPAHDERDFEFAKKYNLGIIEVIIPETQNYNSKLKILEQAFIDDGILVNSDQYDNLTSEQAREGMVKWLEKNNLGGRKINYKLRDWLISRQRYWGAPIPIIYCDECAKKKEQVLILHGWEDSSKSVFIPALKENLELKRYKVFAFDAPNTNEPDYDIWHSFIEKKIKENNLENFHLIGHSMGGHLAAKLAEKYRLKSLLLVAPVGFSSSDKYFMQFVDKLSGEEMEIFKKYQNRKLNIKKVKNNVQKINIVFGEKDEWIDGFIREFYIKNFKDVACIEVLKDYAHMDASEKVSRVEFLENLFNISNPGITPVPEKDLPVKLPDDVDFKPTGESPLVHSKKFHKVKCPTCGQPARRESDTMDTFVCSSWYYFRYADPENKKEFASKEKIKKWLPVDLYVGGVEHTVLHLLYSRFFTKALHKFGYIDFDEPFLKLRHQGIILAEDGRKMSKSFGNIINPDEVAEEYGADSLRCFEMFMGPLEDMKPWNTKGIIGVKRFLEKVWKLQKKFEIQNPKSKTNPKSEIQNPKINNILHKTIKKVTEDIENMKFNTAISAMMILLNEMEKEEEISIIHYSLFLILLSPFAPHLAEELWEKLGNKERIFKQSWPIYDPELVRDEKTILVLQVNGKLRDTVEVEAEISEEGAKKIALASEKIKKWFEGKEIVKVIYVKGKLVNVVVK